MIELGRKKILLIGTFSIAVVNSLIATTMFFDYAGMSRYLVILFILGYSTSLGPSPWVLISEILPAKGVSLTVTFERCAISFLTVIYKPLADLLGFHNIFYFFSFCNIAVAFYIFIGLLTYFFLYKGDKGEFRDGE